MNQNRSFLPMTEDRDRLVEALRQLAPSVRKSVDQAWSRTPALRVIDCVLSLNRNYDRVVVPRLDCFKQKYPKVCSVSELHDEIARSSSPYGFIREALDYNDKARAVTLNAVVDWLVTVSGRGTHDAQLANLTHWARVAPPADFAGLHIRGFGLAGFQYLRMLFGADTTKPDLHIRGFVEKAIGHPVSPLRVLELLQQAASEVAISLRDIDTTIWEQSARCTQKC